MTTVKFTVSKNTRTPKSRWVDLQEQVGLSDPRPERAQFHFFCEPCDKDIWCTIFRETKCQFHIHS